MTGASLIDGKGGPIWHNATVLIDGSRISAVGDADDFGSEIAGCTTVALPGKFLLPGLINVHEHVSSKRLRGSREERARAGPMDLLALGLRNALLGLREGFTTIRDAGSHYGIAMEVKRALAQGLFAGPRMVATIQALTPTGGYAHAFCQEVDTPLEARKAAAQMIKQGADWIKCMASIEWELGEGEPLSAVNMDVETMRAAFDIAHHHGKLCMAHAIADEAVRNAAEAGVDTIEHGIFLTPATAALLAKREIFLVPTMSGYREHGNDWGRGEGTMRHGKLLAPHQVPALAAAREAGVKIAYGSDTLGNVVDEVALMREAGMPAMDCITALTRTGAELLRLDHEIGTIAAGKCADLVVLDSDPCTDPKAFARISLILRQGRILDPRHIPI